MYMLMVPELAIALLECARIGAIHSVVFGGFSAQLIFAFQLTGRYMVTQKLEYMKNMIGAMEQMAEPTSALGEAEFNEMMRTPIMKDLLKDLNDHIDQIASKVGGKIRKEVKEVSPMEPIPINKEQLEAFLADFVPS